MSDALNWPVEGPDLYVSSSQTTLARPRAAKGRLNSAQASPWPLPAGVADQSTGITRETDT